MKSNYKRLGPYICEIDIRNKEDKRDNLLGVSTRKIFIKSVANTVGTNFKKYKIVKKGQFTYVPDTSRRGDKIGLAMLGHLDEGLVSQVYTVFEVVDKDKLDPEYLMMWFRRPEFDRYARYMSHGSVREIFGWGEMCDVELPIPHIDKQREIVREYNVIIDRIKLNEQLCTKLEETAQALYKHWFVDFEFPISADYATSIGKPELEGKPYKSNGGQMKYCEELEKEIPQSWSSADFGRLINLQNGNAFKSNEFTAKGNTPVIKIKNITPPKVDLVDAQFYGGEVDSNLEKFLVNSGAILISMTGSHMNQIDSAVGKVGKYSYSLPALINQRVACLKPKETAPFEEFVYHLISSDDSQKKLLFGATGSANQANISPDQIKSLIIPLAPDDIMHKYEKLCKPLSAHILFKETEIRSSQKLKELLLLRSVKLAV